MVADLTGLCFRAFLSTHHHSFLLVIAQPIHTKNERIGVGSGRLACLNLALKLHDWRCTRSKLKHFSYSECDLHLSFEVGLERRRETHASGPEEGVYSHT